MVCSLWKWGCEMGWWVGLVGRCRGGDGGFVMMAVAESDLGGAALVGMRFFCIYSTTATYRGWGEESGIRYHRGSKALYCTQ